jgi:hypothetical protein
VVAGVIFVDQFCVNPGYCVFDTWTGTAGMPPNSFKAVGGADREPPAETFVLVDENIDAESPSCSDERPGH